ncbi:hypothetical protein BG006_004483, partial [Podila minutissima]
MADAHEGPVNGVTNIERLSLDQDDSTTSASSTSTPQERPRTTNVLKSQHSNDLDKEFLEDMQRELDKAVEERQALLRTLIYERKNIQTDPTVAGLNKHIRGLENDIALYKRSALEAKHLRNAVK